MERMGMMGAAMVEGLGTGKEFLRDLSTKVWEAVGGGVGRFMAGLGLEGSGVAAIWAWILTCVLLVLGLLLIQEVIRALFRKRKRRAEETEADGAESWLALSLEAVRGPVHLVVWICGIYFILVSVGGAIASVLYDVALFAAMLWLFFRLTGVLEGRLKFFTKGTKGSTDDFLVVLAMKSLRVVIPVIAVVFALPMLGLPESFQAIVYTSSSLLIICAVAWVLIQAVFLLEKLILSRYDIDVADNLRAREVHTQVHVLKKTALAIIGVLAISLVLMSFPQMRRLGTSILASAGVLGIIIGFAVQRMIANLFAGFQLAMTQPIRLDDVVIVEGEWGRIEEITLTYVVVRIWDLRRLIVPMSHFIERPFQNWTRVSADILGTVFFHADYRIPVGEVRKELKRVVEASELWDGKVVGLIVSDVKERTVELRALVSAADSGKTWNLRCEVREKLLDFLQREYPQYLPKVRASIGEEGSMREWNKKEPGSGPEGAA